MSFSVAIYFVRREYGGPEEGGWWFDVGAPAIGADLERHTRRFPTWHEADAYADTLESEVVEPLNRGVRGLGAILSSGIYRAQVADGDPRPFPERRPVYE